MHNDTRKVYQAFTAQIANLNGVEASWVREGSSFSIQPAVETKLEERIKESSEFLKSITIQPVINQKGRKVGIGVNSTIAGRSDTENNQPRETRDPTGMDQFGYVCEQTNFDTHLSYAKLDAWRHHPKFQKLVSDTIVKQTARDRIMIGFHGTHAAVQSNRNQHPLLQDVNVGWLEKIRKEAPDHHLQGIKIGPSLSINEGFKNLNAAVYMAVNELIAPWAQDDTDLVVMLGRSLFADYFGGLINDYGEPSEQRSTDVLMANKKVGGLKAIRPPSFPDNAFLITPLSNLSIYWQEGSRRRHLSEEPKLNRVENFDSVNESYNVEDYAKVAFVEDIIMEEKKTA